MLALRLQFWVLKSVSFLKQEPSQVPATTPTHAALLWAKGLSSWLCHLGPTFRLTASPAQQTAELRRPSWSHNWPVTRIITTVGASPKTQQTLLSAIEDMMSATIPDLTTHKWTTKTHQPDKSKCSFESPWFYCKEANIKKNHPTTLYA